MVGLLSLLSPLQESEVKWASRWDTYLTMSDVQIHWFSIVNSVVVVFFLSGMSSVFTNSAQFSCHWLNVYIHIVKQCKSSMDFCEYDVSLLNLYFMLYIKIHVLLDNSMWIVCWFSSWLTSLSFPTFSLSGILSMIIIRTLRKDIANYNREDDIVRKYT